MSQSELIADIILFVRMHIRIIGLSVNYNWRHYSIIKEHELMSSNKFIFHLQPMFTRLSYPFWYLKSYGAANI